MKNITRGLLIFFLLSVGSKVSYGQLNKQAVQDLIYRIIPGQADCFKIQHIPQESNHDVFELESSQGKIILRGNNGVSVASALNYYLRHYCHCLITWNGTNLDLPDTLPDVTGFIHKKTPYTYRYYFNYCTFNYSMSWWDWDRWQKEIDWMALNGINMPLALTGQNSIWKRVYQNLGFSDKELDDFFSGPAYFSWFWMGNLDGWGGPLPDSWMRSHKVLQKKILKRERALGMKPVLPAFSGHVPPGFKKKFPNTKVRNISWGGGSSGFSEVSLLDPVDSMFVEIGKQFMKEEIATYGTDHLYSADTFNEITPPSKNSDFLSGVSRQVYQSMATVDPQAVWVMQGWLFVNASKFWKKPQMKALLNAVPDRNMIILDLWSEKAPVWNRTEAYYGKPWIWNMLHNFGGNISLYGKMDAVAEDPAQALNNPASGKMMGIGLTMEGIEQNPAIYQLMLDNTWRNQPIDLSEWLSNYAYSRYSKKIPDAEKGWQILGNSVYSDTSSGYQSGGPESIITARPTLDKKARWVRTDLMYNPSKLVKAWNYFIKASSKLKDNEGFQYDLVDVTRQVLANYALTLQQEVTYSYRTSNPERFRRSSDAFLELLDDIDTLLATREDFLLGKWLHDARQWGTNRQEKDLYELNARDLITLWGGKDSPLHEYACKQWAGLIKGFYKPRWQKFFSYLETSLRHGETADLKSFGKKIKKWEWQWVHNHESYAAQPYGDPVATSKKMYEKYYNQVRASLK